MDNDPKKIIAKPPLNLLFNPTFVRRKDIWNVDITTLLEMLLEVISKANDKDLRVCGIAALSSAMIHRIKVESIFDLERIAMQRKGLEYPKVYRSIPELKPIEVPFRIGSPYPVSLTELLLALENIISELANPKQKEGQIDLVSHPGFDFDQYLVKLEEILKQYQDRILYSLKNQGSELFRNLIDGLQPIEIVRTFMAVLYLCNSNTLDI